MDCEALASELEKKLKSVNKKQIDTFVNLLV